MSIKIQPPISIYIILCFILHGSLLAQDINNARRHIEALSSPEMHGRGYVFKGDSIAAAYIKKEMLSIGLSAFDQGFYQFFNISVNTLPGALSLSINNNNLMPGFDFLVETPSLGHTGTFRARTISHNTSDRRIRRLERRGLENKVLVIDNTSERKKRNKLFNKLKFYNNFGAEAVIFLTDEEKPLMWRTYTGHLRLDFPTLVLHQESFKRRVRRVTMDIENVFYPAYQTQNVIGYVEGYAVPDSFIVFTAHYDHLGRMGAETYFPGAHDNASGVALMLDLAKYYSRNPPPYSVAFIATAAEEAGLLGSRYYTNNPLFPLSDIMFLINLDMVSTGEDGMMVVNGEIFVEDFLRLKKINNTHGFMREIRSRGEAANSDHYFFYINNVKSFFFYTLGGQTHYHNIYDKPETLSLYAYDNLFQLIVSFVHDTFKK